jgi:hypothetical protein
MIADEGMQKSRLQNVLMVYLRVQIIAVFSKEFGINAPRAGSVSNRRRRSQRKGYM